MSWQSTQVRSSKKLASPCKRSSPRRCDSERSLFWWVGALIISIIFFCISWIIKKNCSFCGLAKFLWISVKKNTFPTIRCFFLETSGGAKAGPLGQDDTGPGDSTHRWARWTDVKMTTCRRFNDYKLWRNEAQWLEIWKMMKEMFVFCLFVFCCYPLAKCGGWWWWRCQSAIGFFFFFFLFFWWFQHVPKVFIFTSIWWIWSQCHNGTLFPPFLCFWDWNHQLEMIIVHREAAHPESSGVLGGLSRRRTLQSGFWCSLTVEQRWKKGKTWRQENTPKTNILNPKNWWFVHVRKWELTNLCNWKKWLGEQVFEVLFLMRWRCCW